MQSTAAPTASDLKTAAHADFDSVSFDIDSSTQIGAIDTGYDAADTQWGTAWASNYVDTGLANSFAGGSYDSGVYAWHGTSVADTVAYMLQDGSLHSDAIVPMKVINSDNEITASAMRSAIEYSLTNDIPVINISVETVANKSYCPSTLCEELESYATAGYEATCATGHDSKEAEVCHPATSYYTVGVGGYKGSCSGGYHRYSHPDGGSNYGDIIYWDSYFKTRCSWCYNAAGASEFQPNIYACRHFSTGDLDMEGNSYSAPQAAAAGAIHHSIYGTTSYSTKSSNYGQMNDHVICESAASLQGDVLNVPDVT